MPTMYCIIGKSASGKDSIACEIARQANVQRWTACTTRPMRKNEREGNPYHFVSSKEEMVCAKPFTRIDGTYYYGFSKAESVFDKDILVVASIAHAKKLYEEYGKSYHLVMIYIQADEEERLIHAIRREEQNENPDYKEICRRMESDYRDFSDRNPDFCEIHRMTRDWITVVNDYRTPPEEIAAELIYNLGIPRKEKND